MRRTAFRLLTTLVLLATLATMAIPALAEGPEPNPPGRGNVTFRGIIESKDNGTWVVSGVTVQVTGTTVIIETAGPAEVGAEVMVTGKQQVDRTVVARVIKVLKPVTVPKRPVNFTAPIVALPASGVLGEWTVGGETVVVSETTKIQPQGVVPQLRDIAHVVGYRNEDGTVAAALIEIRNPSLVEVEFVGPIISMTDSEWMVRNVRVILTSETVVEGTPEVGKVAEVKGFLHPDRSVTATHITVREPQQEPEAIGFQGIILRKSSEELPAVWQIRLLTALSVYPGLVNVTVTEDTIIDDKKGPADVGALVLVVAARAPTTTAAAEVNLVAKRIKVLRPPVNQDIVFAGPIEEMHDGMWVVKGIRVLITDTTVIDGEPAVGKFAIVTGVLRTDGVVEASQIVIKDPAATVLEFDGVIREMTERLPGIWMIAPDGPLTVILPVWVNPDTIIDETAGDVKVGAHVHVVAHIQGKIVAYSITVLAPPTP